MKTPAIATVAACALLLCACTVGPDYKRPDLGAPQGFLADPIPAATAHANVAGGEKQGFRIDGQVPANWWTLFRSAALDELVEEALRSNPALRSAEAAVRVAEESALAQRGALFPSVQGSWNSARERVPEQLASPVASNALIFNLHSAQVAVSYMFDVFGLERRQVESAEAQAQAQRFQRDAARLMVASNVVVAVIQEAAFRGQLEASRDIVRIEREQLELMRRQLALGAIPRLNVVAQEASLSQAEAQVPPIEKQLAQQRHSLAVLLGRYPSQEPGRFELATLSLPQDLPVALPSSVVEHRPDIRAAEEQLRAASAQVGVATANMLPQITLTAGVGYQSTALSSLFAPDSLLWNFGAGLAQPIVQGGALLHRRRAAEAAYEQAAAQYRQVVLGAFQNIADALRAVEIDARALEAAAKAEAATRENLAMTRKQLELGDTNYLGLLAAEQAYEQAVIARVQAQAARLTDTAALFTALGGAISQERNAPTR